MGFVAVDTDITGNTSPAPGTNSPFNPVNGGVDVPGGTVQSCIGGVGIGQQVTIDVVVDEVDIGDRLDGFQYQLSFDPAVVNGVGFADINQMLAANTLGFNPTQFFGSLNNATGVWGIGVTEFITTDPGEFGNGVLARHTFQAVGAGGSQLTVATTGALGLLLQRPAPDFTPIPVTTVLNGSIVVGDPTGCADADGDGVVDAADNCPDTANPGQEDDVHPGGKGDACDDPDVDGVVDADDNCPSIGNSAQTDSDSDGVGDACDNCPSVPNPDQINTYGDNRGDACESIGGAVEIATGGSGPSSASAESSARDYAAPIAAAVAVGATALAAAGWYARRRWLR